VVVAAAGNSGLCRPFFPAALPTVVGVGALDSAGRAWFSNFGGWVDACAPGVGVVSTFFFGTTEPLKPKKSQDHARFDGWAQWSGTSFSAPKVAAAIAQEMILGGSGAPAAWTRVGDYRRFRYPDLGVVVNL